MTKNSSPFCSWVFAFICVLGFVLAGYVSVKLHQPILGGVILIFFAAATFALLLQARLKRVMKGGLLVALGVVTPFVYTICIASQFNDALAYGDLWFSTLLGANAAYGLDTGRNLLETWSSFINLACAGAGGSIIAVAGERTIVESPSNSASSENAASPLVEGSRVIGLIEKALNRHKHEVHSLTQQAGMLRTKHDRLKSLLLGVGIGVLITVVAFSSALLLLR
ncbi:hypothetical protein QO207_18030 [Pseudomonas sp. CAN2814]|uniref:hypothetical protein n=1 Tax=Pseudomonas sp. CAN1 TaxID=3046726 RepID=UPI0026475843|nr:hypothetical protein [Pseudomonas sp. CAN1]MDN6858494.1 hypothetical protein [Pseudomonas sp. CAN1]